MAAARPVLIVEDNPAQRELLAEGLRLTKEFEVSATGTLNEANELLDAPGARFDAVILDLDMPDGGGRSYCAWLRRQGHHMPIIIMTTSDDEIDIVRGLDAGANDCVPKPFRFNELVARLRAQLRIFDNSEHAALTIGQYTFRPAARLLTDPKNRRLHLTAKETAILKFLYRAGERPVARSELLDKVWGYNSGVTTHTLETHIYRLRQKIESNRAVSRLLLTERSGYRLNIAVDAEGVAG